ncbi:hypothetical protein ACWGF3_17820 [Streptomyces xanthophaeus]
MGGEFCVYCDHPVPTLPANVVDDSEFSASGVRPPSYAHPDCSPGSNRAAQRTAPAQQR